MHTKATQATSTITRLQGRMVLIVIACTLIAICMLRRNNGTAEYSSSLRIFRSETKTDHQLELQDPHKETRTQVGELFGQFIGGPRKEMEDVNKLRIPLIQLAGAQKASTTSVAKHLQDSGFTCFSNKGKEAHFFDNDDKYIGGLDFYKDLFRDCLGRKNLIDATPETMLEPQRVRAIYDEMGVADQVKILFILREPVSREISWYNHRLRLHNTTNAPFWSKTILDDDGKSVLPFGELMRRTVIRHMKQLNSKYAHDMYSYYAHWLKLWMDLFPRKQILVLSYDELKKNPRTLMARVYSFLDIRPKGSLNLPHFNTNSKKTPPPPCHDQIELARMFVKPNNELYKLLEENPGPSQEQRPFPKFKWDCAKH